MKCSLPAISSLMLILAFLLPGSTAFAQSSRPLTSPTCFGDGLPNNNPPIQPCDGLPHSSCNVQYSENVKAIGSGDGEGQIGQLQLYYSPTNGNGCNAWSAAVYITHAGCFLVNGVVQVETGHDSSVEDIQSLPKKLCQGNYFFTPLVGDYQPGGCYYAYSYVDDASLNEQHTSTATFCYQGTH